MNERLAVVLGAGGMLARELMPALVAAGWDLRAVSRAGCDITDHDAVTTAVRGARLMANCAAYTDVERAETEPYAAWRINADGAGVVARAAASLDVPLLHLSTDYVFDGTLPRPYVETDSIAPLGAYARSKAAGEAAIAAECQRAWIVRTGGLYGDGGRNFVDSILRRARHGERLRVVADQRAQPTWTRDLAAQLVALIEADVPPGIYHAAAGGAATWLEIARVALSLAGLSDTPVDPIPLAAYGGRAPRPAHSVLEPAALRKLGLYRMCPWQDALAEWLAGRAHASASAT